MQSARYSTNNGIKRSNPSYDQFALEGDGLIENFFHLLWTKQEFTLKSN